MHAHAVALGGLSVLSARTGGATPIVMRTVPHRYMVLSLQLGEALGSYEGEAPCWRGSALSGLRSGPVTYVARPGTHAVVALLPLRAAYLLTRALPPARVRHQRIPLADAMGHARTRSLEDAVRAAPRAHAARTMALHLQRMLRERASAVRPDAARAFAAYDLLAERPAGSLAEVAACVGITRRQLERDCARWLGESPHQLLMQSRARRVLVALQTHDALASIAASAGYADQAHMTRALRQLTLRTPRQWAREELSALGKTYLQTSGELITW